MYQYGPRLGNGTYGRVYSITDKVTKRPHALKRFLVSEKAKVAYLTNIKEMDIMSRLVHPHVMPLDDVCFRKQDLSPVDGMRDDRLYLVMPRAPETLVDWIPESTLEQRKYILWQLLAGVNHIHKHGIIHRDLKPANILIFPGPVAKISDFGMSTQYTACEDRSPNQVTLWYRAPEILQGKDYDTKSDIWSLGCIFYEILTGRALFSSENEQELSAKITNFFQENDTQEKQVHHYFNRVKDQDLADLLSRILQVDPEVRYNCYQLCNHDFFDSYRGELIQVVSQTPKEHTLQLVPERAEGIRKIIDAQTNASYHVKFLAVDILDRILMDRLYSEPDEVRRYALVAFYLAEKYTLGENSRPFNGLCVNTPSDHEGYGKLEKEVVRDILQYRVYRLTPYNYLPRGSTLAEMANLYSVYSQCHFLTGLTARQITTMVLYISRNEHPVFSTTQLVPLKIE